MSTLKFESAVENHAKSAAERRIAGFPGLAVLFEMNPSLRDLCEEELFQLLISHELVNEWSFCGRSEPGKSFDPIALFHGGNQNARGQTPQGLRHEMGREAQFKGD